MTDNKEVTTMKTFKYLDQEVEYPHSFSYQANDGWGERLRMEYRREYQHQKEEEVLLRQEAQMPYSAKMKRFGRNAALETAALSLEVLCAPFILGGMTVTFDGIREKKRLPYRKRDRSPQRYRSPYV